MYQESDEYLRNQMAAILCRLPVKSVLRFRGLSRDLRSLIDSPQFALLYFQSCQFRSRIFLLLFRRHITASSHGSCRLSFPLQQPRWISTDLGPIATGVWNVNAALIGSYRGVVCIAFSSFDVCLWNPSTRTHKHLPFHPYSYEGAAHRRVRFGFGPCGDQEGDYMVTRTVVSYPPKTREFFDLSVYRLSTNSWVRHNLRAWTCVFFLDDDLSENWQNGWEFGESGVYSHGSLYWLVDPFLKPPVPYKLMLYRLGTPFSTSKIKLPTSILGQRDYTSVLNMSLSSIDETLFLACQFCTEFNEAEIWKLENYEDPESWSRILAINGYFERLKPVVVAEDGKKILMRVDSKLVWYDLETGRRMEDSEILPDNGPNRLSDAMDLFESLTPIHGGQTQCEEA